MMDLGCEDGFAPARVAVPLKEFAQRDDEREPWRVMYPPAEMLLLVTCATVAPCDDVDDIVAFGKHHLHDLRRHAPFHHGMPCARWIRAPVNRIDPDLSAACFESWIEAMWPDRHDLIAIDGKASRRSYQKGANSPIRMVSAFAARQRLVLGQVKVDSMSNEIAAIPKLLDLMAIEGAIVTIVLRQAQDEGD